MKQITINNHEFEFADFNRSINIIDNSVNDHINLYFKSHDVWTELNSMLSETITTITIEIYGDTVYELTGINGKITSLSEILENDGNMAVSAMIKVEYD